jgi:hypothetical protein
MKQSKIKTIHVIALFWVILFSTIIAYQFNVVVNAYKANHNNFESQLNLVICLFIFISGFFIFKGLRYLGIFSLILFSSCGSKYEVAKPTIIFSIDSLENIEAHLYNEWE